MSFQRQELHPEASRLGRTALYALTSHILIAPPLGVWLQECTAKIFNICRVPQPRCDIISEVPSFITPDARKVLLSVHDWCYVIEVLDDALKIISAVEIQKRIHAVVQDVNSRLARGERAIPVGVLSADERDKWTKVSILNLDLISELTSMRVSESPISSFPVPTKSRYSENHSKLPLCDESRSLYQSSAISVAWSSCNGQPARTRCTSMQHPCWAPPPSCTQPLVRQAFDIHRRAKHTRWCDG